MRLPIKAPSRLLVEVKWGLLVHLGLGTPNELVYVVFPRSVSPQDVPHCLNLSPLFEQAAGKTNKSIYAGFYLGDFLRLFLPLPRLPR